MRREHECSKDFPDHPDRTGRRRSDRLRLLRRLEYPVLRREHGCSKDFSDHPDRTGRRRSDRLRLLRRLETHDILACSRHTDRDCHILTLGDFHVYTRRN